MTLLIELSLLTESTVKRNAVFTAKCKQITFFVLEGFQNGSSILSLLIPQIWNIDAVTIIITCWIRCCPHRRSWSDFLWSLSLPRLAILFDRVHPRSPVHFFSSHSLLAFSTIVSVFFYYRSFQISKPSLSHFRLLSSKHDRTTAYYLL